MTATPDAALILWVSNEQIRIMFRGVEHDLTLPGKWRRDFSGQRPVAPGDWIRILDDEGRLRAIEVLPRRNEFTRKVAGLRPLPQVAAANIDQVMVMAAAESPRTSYGLIDRLLVTAAIGGVESCLLLNKCDLASDDRLADIRRTYASADIPIYFLSVATGEGVEPIRNLLLSKTTLLAGPSGSGKSSLANIIQPGLKLRTAEISSATGKGRHVTTSARLHPLSTGGWLIDTPGLRECAPWGLTRQNLLSAFPEFEANGHRCRFRNCLHKDEAGCNVLICVENQEIARSRYETYRKLLVEAEKNERKY